MTSRSAPDDVPPVVHKGVRYEAPSYLESGARDPNWQLKERMQMALLRGGVSDENPARARAVLEKAGFAADDVGAYFRNAEMESRVAEAIAEDIEREMKKVFGNMDTWGEGGMGFPEHLAERLRKKSFTEEEIEAARRIWRGCVGDGGPPSEPVEHHGHIVAFDSKGHELWSLQVYRDEGCFITSLAIEDEILIVRDENRRVHRVDLERRKVIESFVDRNPTALDLARLALRTIAPARRRVLWDRLWSLKGNMDRHNIAASMPILGKRFEELGAMMEMPELKGNPDLAELLGELKNDPDLADLLGQLQSIPDLEAEMGGLPAKGQTTPKENRAAIDRDLQALLVELKSIAHLDPLVETAHAAGLRHEQALAHGEDPHVLFDWFGKELSWIFEELFPRDMFGGSTED